MKIKVTRLYLLLGALVCPASLYALGLGDIHLNSALNQTLDADVELVGTHADELAGAKVAIANEETFVRYGLNRSDFLSDLSLRIEAAASNQPLIKIRSTRPVTEPFLSLLLEVNWSSGRVLREYTVLLDPPTFTAHSVEAAATSAPETVTAVGEPLEDNVSAALQSAADTSGIIKRAGPTIEETAQSAETVTESTTDTLDVTSESSLEPSSEPSSEPESIVATPSVAPSQFQNSADIAQQQASSEIDQETYLVQRADTLSEIVRALRPGSSRATLNKTMIALFRANPAAFGDSINMLRAGAVLRIPPTVEIDAISAREAGQEVARQYGAWRAARGITPEDQGSRLRLVPPQNETAAEATVAQATEKTVAESAQEKAAKAGRAAQEAQAAQAAAEAQRLLNLKNAELAALQQKVSPPVTEAPQSESSTPSVQANAVTSTPVEEQPVVSESELEPTPHTTPVSKPPVAQEPVSTAQGQSVLERLAGYWLWLVVAGVVLIGVLFIYFRKRQAGQAAQTLEAGGAVDVEDLTFTRESTEQEEGFNFVTAESASAGAAQPQEATDPLDPREQTLSSDSVLQVDQQDAMAEADFHMAYGLYDQAADLVKIAVQREPGRRDLKLKLLEIYFVWANKDLFLEMARELYQTRDQGTPEEWDKILIMGKQICPNEPLFAANIAGSRSPDSIDVNLDGGEGQVDMDVFGTTEAASTAPDSDVDQSTASAAAGSGLDFLLDDAARTQENPTIESPTVESPTIESPTIESPTIEAPRGDYENTTELAEDELNLDSFGATGAYPADEMELGADELTRIAPQGQLSSLDKTVETPRPDLSKTVLASQVRDIDDEASGVLQLDQIDLGLEDAEESNAQNEQNDVAGMFQRTQRLDMDLDRIAKPYSDTGNGALPHTDDDNEFAADVFAADKQSATAIDLDVGASGIMSGLEDNGDTSIENSLELPELEPVTMSEVGTKLDLARAYMDMGDPDGARNILEEVLQEGHSAQQQEAQRLLDSIR